ncbi:PRA1 family protein-domain-containing protein [Xylariaceae sp. AK1471]|nr:PRA1 family protein-domain-containing protein [Xylariaceae sp. AK1471]
MSRIQIPLDLITSRLNIGDRFSGFRNTSLSSRFANLKPIGEFLDFKRFSKPANFAEVQLRVNYNLSTFSSNYAVVFVLLGIYALYQNPLLLFDIILLVGGLSLLGRLNGQDVTIGTFTATSSQLYTGLFCTFGFIFLLASPFSTVLWLIGFFRGGGLGGRPRAPKFSPSWGRPSGRGQTRYTAPGDDDFWDTRRRVVEELDSDDTDTQGAGVATTSGNRRFASDELRFTGIDMGGGRSRNKYAYQNSDDNDDSTESNSQATTDNDTEDEARAEMENALVQSALARIRKAKAKGKQDVKLNKEELAALERRRKRLQAEADAKKKDTGRKRKEKEQRVAVPLSHFDPPLPGRGGLSASDDALPRHPLPSTIVHSQGQPGPPTGLFPLPGSSQTRPRSSTSSRRPSLRHGSSSPFEYQYVSPHSNQRHTPDTPRPSSSRTPLPHEEDWRPQSSPSPPRIPDPFQYQTAGPRAPYPTSAVAARRIPGAFDMAYNGVSRSSAPATARSVSNEITPDDDDTGSDDDGNGVHIARNTSQEDVIVVESSPEPELGRSRAKRKPASGGGGRRRKGK